MIRFLHTADWQIGRQYTRFAAEDGAALAEARCAVVAHIAGHARDGHFDAVLVAGDIFDAQTVNDRTIRRLFNAMQDFDGPWVMLSGNHDAALAESVWTRAIQLNAVPSNVYLALAPEPLVLDNLHTVILPAPLTQRQTDLDLTAWFDHASSPERYFRIGLAHGSVQGLLSDDVDSSNPIARQRAQNAGLDYLALGDWHGMRRVDDRSWYSGTPETDRFRNNESGHILEVTIESPGAAPAVRPVPVGQYRWDLKMIQLALPSDVDTVQQYLDTLSEKHVAALTLTGRINLADQARLNQALGVAEARVRAFECNTQALRLQPTDDDIASLQADGYLADVLHALLEMQEMDENFSQRPPPDGAQEIELSDARVARDALALLASIMQDRS